MIHKKGQTCSTKFDMSRLKKTAPLTFIRFVYHWQKTNLHLLKAHKITHLNSTWPQYIFTYCLPKVLSTWNEAWLSKKWKKLSSVTFRVNNISISYRRKSQNPQFEWWHTCKFKCSNFQLLSPELLESGNTNSIQKIWFINTCSCLEMHPLHNRHFKKKLLRSLIK